MCSLFWLAFVSTHWGQNKDKCGSSSFLKRKSLKTLCLLYFDTVRYFILWDLCCSLFSWTKRTWTLMHLCLSDKWFYHPWSPFMDLFVKIVFLLFYWYEHALVPLFSPPQWQITHTASYSHSQLSSWTQGTQSFIRGESDTWLDEYHCRRSCWSTSFEYTDSVC